MILGAFGAHALESILSAKDLDTWQTGVLYQFVHALALLGVGAWALSGSGRFLRLAAWSFLLGILIFSGSLYLLVATDTRWLGAITPIGGIAFIVGWIALALSAWHLEDRRE